MNTLFRRLCSAVLICVIGCSIPVFAADGDDDLPTLDELLNIQTEKTKLGAPGDREAMPKPGEPMAEGEQGNPLEQVFSEMRNVSQRLGEDRDPGLETQRLQESILARLDQLIKAAKQSQNSSSSSSSSASQSSDASQQQASQQNSGKSGSDPAGGNQSQEQEGGAAAPRNGDVNEPLEQNRAEWGNLPPRLREQLLQGSGERFSPIYRELTEAYYRRLAEEGE